jgi:hypothetical protein
VGPRNFSYQGSHPWFCQGGCPCQESSSSIGNNTLKRSNEAMPQHSIVSAYSTSSHLTSISSRSIRTPCTGYSRSPLDSSTNTRSGPLNHPSRPPDCCCVGHKVGILLIIWGRGGGERQRETGGGERQERLGEERGKRV